MSKLKRLADRAGIHENYEDISGKICITSDETRGAMLAAMGLPAATEAEAAEALADLDAGNAGRVSPEWLVLEAGAVWDLQTDELPGSWVLNFEDGRVVEGRGALTMLLPLGIHRLLVDGHQTVLLAAPRKLPAPKKGWGVTMPLHGLRPPGRGGLGDLDDLANAATVLGQLGAAFVGINPIHAGFPTDPAAISPYSPSHRRRINPLIIPNPIEDAGLGQPLLNYPESTSRRMADLRTRFESIEAEEGFTRFLAEQGDSLLHFATHQALSASHGPYWQAWPSRFKAVANRSVADFAAAHADEIRFHTWLQWCAGKALQDAAEHAGAAGMHQGLYLDLAVGTHPHGAETWERPQDFARGVSLGAPPDAFSPAGQSWTLAPLNPQTLVSQAFAPLAETLRAQLRYAGMMRIDHVLGFERAFWVPENGVPGGYVAMPRDAMLAVARIETARAGAVIVGEDLGNVPKGLGAALDTSGIMGCRVLQFQRDYARDGAFLPAETWDEAAIASFGTHDLPTWAGWRSGEDISSRVSAGVTPPEEAHTENAQRKSDVAALDALIGPDAHHPSALEGFLARTPAYLVALQIEDLLNLKEQPNLPGTIDSHPNWRRRLPVGVDNTSALDSFDRAATIMARHGRRR